jgi:hypothetical protein
MNLGFQSRDPIKRSSSLRWSLGPRRSALTLPAGPGAATHRRGNRYRYYISSALLRDRREGAGSRARIGANDVERLVVGVMGRELSRTELLTDGASGVWSAEVRTLLRDAIERVVVHRDEVHIIGVEDRLVLGR